MADFKLTYATMFNPPEELHTLMGAGQIESQPWPGIRPADRWQRRFRRREIRRPHPHQHRKAAGRGPEGQRKTRPDGASRPPARPSRAGATRPGRSASRFCARRAALIEERLFDMGAALSMEVGKNRMEALGDVQETADLIYYACDQMEANNGYIVTMGRDPLAGLQCHQRLRPAALWRLAGDQPVQLPVRADGRPCRRGPGGRQYRRDQARHRYALDRPPAGRLLPRCRPAGRRVQLRDGPGAPSGRRWSTTRLWMASPSPARLTSACSIYQDFATATTSARSSWSWAARTRPSSRAMPTWRRRDRHSPLGLRSAGAEMLGCQPRVSSKSPCTMTLVGQAQGPDRKPGHRRPDRAQGLSWGR